MVIIIGDNFFDGLQVVFGTMLVWSEVGTAAPDPGLGGFPFPGVIPVPVPCCWVRWGWEHIPCEEGTHGIVFSLLCDIIE